MSREQVLENKMLYEMANQELAEEILRLVLNKRQFQYAFMSYLLVNSEDELDENDEDESDEDLVLFFLGILQDIDECDEQDIALAVKSILERVLSSPLSILRPYQINTDGSNRVTWRNFKQKFSGHFENFFRFSEHDILLLLDELQIPEQVCFNGYHAIGLECFLLMLHRLTTGCRYVDLVHIYDLRPQILSVLFNGMVLFMFKMWGNHVRSIRHNWMTSRAMLDMYAEATRRKCVPLANTVSFLDGVTVGIAKPVRGQRSMYNGHKRKHCFKSIALQYPNGLLTACGPFDGRLHDSTCAEMLQLDSKLGDIYKYLDQAFKTFGDQGFGVGENIITPFRGTRAEEMQAEREWNMEMSRARISSEWGFGKVKNLFTLITKKSVMRALKSPVACYYFVSVFLANVHTCRHGSQITSFFGMPRPDLEDYLNV